jgi:peptidoglycan hydrolase CwlO-like protein
VENIFASLQKKIKSEEDKITTCNSNIATTKSAIAALQRELASAV